MVFANPLREDLCGGAVALIEGKVRPPEGPGLGIELDRAVLERLTLK
jgi:L-alanine-DL-glutamate epimerase-like enolase superfamily enzyme